MADKYMNHRKIILEQINTISKSLIRKKSWYSKDKPFGHINYKKKKEKNYIYEFYCYVKILKDLKGNYVVELIPGSENFPKSPAKKKDRSKFILRDKSNKNILFQVCAGTEITISTVRNYTIAPDISFQRAGATDYPTENDVELIMDAKYKSNPNNNKLDIKQLQQFAKIIDDLQVNGASSTTLLFDKYIDLLSNCLLTNGNGLEDKDDFCLKNNMKQVEKFDYRKSYNTIG
jgi:hypothetical protein